jgi:hypothetical protein
MRRSEPHRVGVQRHNVHMHAAVRCAVGFCTDSLLMCLSDASTAERTRGAVQALVNYKRNKHKGEVARNEELMKRPAAALY